MLKRTYNSPANGHEEMYNYEGKFIQKIELVRGLPHYEILEKYAQECLYAHTGFGLSAILSRADMNRIIGMSDEQFLEEAKAFLQSAIDRGAEII